MYGGQKLECAKVTSSGLRVFGIPYLRELEEGSGDREPKGAQVHRGRMLKVWVTES